MRSVWRSLPPASLRIVVRSELPLALSGQRRGVVVRSAPDGQLAHGQQTRSAASRPPVGIKEMSGGDVIVEILKANGVDSIFGYSGGAVLPVLDAIHGQESLNFFSSSHEQCCGHSAAAYAKSTGKVGVCIVTSGPGVTNLVTPMYDALTDGVPMIFFSGQVPTGAMGTDAFQECPATEITRPCTKWNYVCLDFSQLPWAINEAFRIAQSGRPGPCHIDLPKDIVSMKAHVPESAIKKVVTADAPPVMDMVSIKKAAELINKAKRPILNVGQGASDCAEAVRRLMKKTQIPVTTTVHGMGIVDENDPLSLHMLGMHGAAYANMAMQNADLIVAIGSRFDDRTTGFVPKYAPKARQAHLDGTGGFIHINIDKSTIGRIIEPTVAVWADCEHALVALEEHVEPSDDPARAEWLDQCQEWKAQHPFGYVKAPDGQIKTQQVIEATHAFLKDKDWMNEKDARFCTGVGNHQMMSAQFIRWTRPRSMITSGSLGVMGVGLPFAIGTQVANPKSLVILIDGDGSFNMTNMDLQTIKRYNLPVKMAIMNDSRQQMVWIWQKLFCDGRFISVENTNPDFAMLAKAHGIASMTCSTEAELPGVIETWLTSEGPMLIDFKVVPDICLPMVAPGKALDQMILLEDRDSLAIDSETDRATRSFEGMAPS